MASLDALQVFAQAVALGSFSAVARKLGKSQSSISTSIANLEIDLGLVLFDRTHRKPVLTGHGQVVLRNVEAVLAAQSKLERAAQELSQGLESRLSVVLSDTYQSDRFEDAMAEFELRYPNLELECLIAECGDLVALVQSGRAQIGFVEAQPRYTPDIGSATVAERAEIALYVAPSHPLASLTKVSVDSLADFRELRLATVLKSVEPPRRGRLWSAPSYLMLMEMAQRGFGWAPIPRWLVGRFASDSLIELKVRGWPKQVAVDAIWSRTYSLGPAGTWLLNRMLQ
jgi:DNA-binding transcriptional LysR family regulator